MADHRAHKMGDIKVLHDTMLDMPKVDEFCTRNLHMVEEGVFGLMKRKLDLPFGVDEGLHKPNKVNFSHPMALIRLLGLFHSHANNSWRGIFQCHGNCTPLPHADDDILSPTPKGRIRQVFVVTETKVNVKEWHIFWLPKIFAKCCWPNSSH